MCTFALMQRKKIPFRFGGLIGGLWGILTLTSGCRNTQVRPSNWLYYNIHGVVTSIDPAYASNLNNMLVVRALFSTLVEVKDDLTIRPGVARRWEVRDSGRTYVFYLRRDVWFHHDPCFPQGVGRRLTAHDVVFSIRRLLDTTIASPGAWLFRNRIQYSPQKGYTEGIYAQDDSTVVFRLRDPFPPFLGLLALPYCGIVPPEAVDYYGQREFGRHPVGSGPFQFHYWVAGEVLSLKRHPNFFRSGKPHLDGLFITFIENPESEFLAFLSGRLDVLSGAQKAMADFFIGWDGHLKPALQDRFRLVRSAFLNTEYLGILQDPSYLPQKSPLHSLPFRKALAFAIDRRKMLRHLRRGLGSPGNHSIIPPAMWPDSTAGYSYYPDSAHYYLREAIRQGVRIQPLTIATTATYLDLCLFVARSWRNLGIPTDVEVYPSSGYHQRMRQGDLPIFRASWIADYPDPESYLSLFYSANVPPFGPNYTRFNNSQYDSVYQYALTASDSARRHAYNQMVNILYHRLPVLVLYYDEIVHILRADVFNLPPHPMGWIEWEEIRKKRGDGP